MSKSNFVMAVSRKIFKRNLSPEYIRLSLERELKTMEGEIGAKIFGPMAANERRSFFNDSLQSWFFHQEKTDALRNVHSVTLHYEVRPEGVLKVSNKSGMKCEYITGQELKNFIDATKIYHERVMKQIYGKSVVTDNQFIA